MAKSIRTAKSIEKEIQTMASETTEIYGYRETMTELFLNRFYNTKQEKFSMPIENAYALIETVDEETAAKFAEFLLLWQYDREKFFRYNSSTFMEKSTLFDKKKTVSIINSLLRYNGRLHIDGVHIKKLNECDILPFCDFDRFIVKAQIIKFESHGKAWYKNAGFTDCYEPTNIPSRDDFIILFGKCTDKQYRSMHRNE